VIGPEHEAPRPAGGEGFSDSLTFAFGDPEGRVLGVARLGLADGGASGLAIVFRDGAPLAVRADGGVAVAEPADWDTVAAAGLTTHTREPLAAWDVAFDGDVPFALSFEALSPPMELEADADAARAGGMQGFDQVCRVTGTVGGEPFAGLGQRGRSWGAPDWDRMALARTLTAWLDERSAVSLVAVRPAKGKGGHADEALAAFVFDAEREDAPVAAVAEPRLSTTYDGEGRQRRAGLELYVGEDDSFARRAAGEVIAGTSLDLGRLRLDCSFFRWRMEGRTGIGRYDILRRT
jgi:hypothetical protein